MKQISGIEMIPSAKRLIRSLRDLGYDFSHAVADIVDNSIEARATVVAIDVEFDGDNSWVRIADNGNGMKPDQLREAMRYGTERDYELDALGKFGLGLKTASMSQCQSLSVASRWNRNRADISAYSWDLAHIERTNRWEILPLGRNDLSPAIRKPLKNTRGTVVLWQRLDRILGYKHPYGEVARKRLSHMCREIELHLGMVFHRFLSGQARRKRLKILVNGNEVQPWDPFCHTESKTKVLQSVVIPLEYQGVSGEIVLEPYILPHQDDFSSMDSFRRASGPANWNQQQGFYIYRANRMIQSGSWSNLRAPDEHTKLARVAINFLPKMDSAFKINVAKMRVQLPPQIRDQVRDAIVPVLRLAREVYGKKPPGSKAVISRGKSAVASKTGETGISQTKASEIQGALQNTATLASNDLFTLDEWAEKLLAIATNRERPMIERVIRRMREDLKN